MRRIKNKNKNKIVTNEIMKELTTLVNKILTFRHATRTLKGVCQETNKAK